MASTGSDSVSDCIVWTGPTNNKGYGTRSFQGKTHLAHRVAFFEARGYWPNVCRHACDNRPCVNPEHLLDGTHADNTQDMMVRGRQRSGRRPRGESHPAAKLTAEDVKTIRRLYSDGCTQVVIAKKYGMGQPTISEIVRGVIWKDVEVGQS